MTATPPSTAVDPQPRTTGTAESTGEDPAVLELDGVTRQFGAETAVANLSLSVQEGELLTLLGPSGCGKTTTLRLLAGLDEPDAGTIRVAGNRVAGEGTFVKPEERDVGLVFQEFALFPHLSVGENVAFGIQDRSDDEIDQRVTDLLELVGLGDYADASPEDLSGGQRQRVALARSLAPEPDVLLLDEPFSNLDVGLREEMRREVRRIIKETGVTAVSVTHDQEEALSISDRVAVIDSGQIEQIGRPEIVFQQPESRFVAEFLGQAGFVSGTLADGCVDTPLGPLSADRIDGLGDEYDGAEIDVLVRPDDIRAVPADPAGTNGRIVDRQYTGPSFVYTVELDSGAVLHCEHNHAEELGMDKRVRVRLATDHPLAWFPA
ncbi:Spermidine-putrescine ABC transporter ATP-binding domain containing protein [Halorhabdus tiamatea SARL4B]|uniref:Molybdate/tungstate import ATP-binding protein WtpC n=1 Tax=Halorhabdus tiamatea SARL4B TaxID=1033806 RepID=F7PFC3_9EURY|nr:ABC transporter ATP-binding protein [Halorhabdus tiamatea]ERJ05753.1 Spermidine-putrescine ABC transporter ATP-binding domain containing protein [Halorhabdus tiamatea SARL4B]CCQ33923.1 ABC-type iron transporter, ATP-binding protein [Halorhabdus tiamatea SARL4B]